MRLIDADAVESAFTVLIYEFVHRAPNWSPNDMLTSGRDTALKYEYKADGVEAALNIVRRMPTIDAETVKYGRWIIHREEIFEPNRSEYYINRLLPTECSVCGFAEMRASRFAFCPNCGADMRGENYHESVHDSPSD